MARRYDMILYLATLALLYWGLYFNTSSELHNSKSSNKAVIKEEPISVKLAFLLLVHDDSSVNGLYDLLDVIYSSHHTYFVHLDLAARAETLERLNNLTLHYSNVRVIAQRFRSSWGAPAIMHAELSLLKAARKHNILAEQNHQRPWDFSLILDGSSYPLRSMSVIEQRISQLHPMDSVLFNDTMWTLCRYGQPKGPKAGSPCDATLARCIDRNCTRQTLTPSNAVVYKGPQWVILSWPFVNYLLTLPDLDPWVSFFGNSHAADELIFPSIAMASPVFRNHALFHLPPRLSLDDGEEIRKKYHGRHKIGYMLTIWGSCRTPMNYRASMKWSPCNLGPLDVDRILGDTSSLFVRKISPNSRLGDELKAVIRRERLRKE